MIKPKYRKGVGITALLINTIALFYAMYSNQLTIAAAALSVNSLCIILWFTSEGFIEFLIASKYKAELKYNKEKDDVKPSQ